MHRQISIHALREEGDRASLGWAHLAGIISIHALREEGDLCGPPAPSHFGISIHALREEGDLGLRYEGDNAKVFLSTPSARRATWQ